MLSTRPLLVKRLGDEMPRFYMEYSANIEPTVDLEALMDRVRAAAIATGTLPLGAIRVRAARREHCRIADAYAGNGFVDIETRIGARRDEAMTARAGGAIFAALCDYLEPLIDILPLGISFHLEEVPTATNYKMNDLHNFVQRLQAQGGEV